MLIPHALLHLGQDRVPRLRRAHRRSGLSPPRPWRTISKVIGHAVASTTSTTDSGGTGVLTTDTARASWRKAPVWPAHRLTGEGRAGDEVMKVFRLFDGAHSGKERGLERPPDLTWGLALHFAGSS